MGATYTRQSTYEDGDTITAAHTNDEFDQLLASFQASSGHTHDGTANEGGPITKLLGTAITLGNGNAGSDIVITYDGETNDGVMKWMEDEDYFEFSDDILIATTEKLQFRDTAIYINSSADGQLDLVADTEIQIAATTIDINGAVDVSGNLSVGGNLDVTGTFDMSDANITNIGSIALDTITNDGTDITLDSSGDIILDADGANVIIKDGGTSILDIANNSTDVELTVSTADKNFKIKGTDGASAITALDIDMALAGKATFSGDIAVAGNAVITGDLTITGDDLVMATNTAGAFLIADGTNFNPTVITDLSEIATAASGDILLAIDASGGGLKKIARSTLVAGLATDSAISNIVEDTSPQLGGNLDTNSQNILIDDAHFIGDESGNEQLIFQTTGSAVNQFDMTNSASSTAFLQGPILQVTGGDSNIDLNLIAKGTGVIAVRGNSASGAIQFNCESNSHGQIVQGQPHSAGVTNTMLLPAGANSTLVSLVSADTLTNKTLTAPKIADGGFIADANGNELVVFQTTSSAVNELEITNNASGSNPIIAATGGDTNIGIVLTPKGTGEIVIAAGNLNYGGDAVTSTGAELNALDGITAVVGELNALDIGSTAVGTAVASKAVILDSNKDYTGIRNFTVSGELDAATGDFSGAIDVAGTANLDVVDIDGAVDMASTLQVDGAITNSSTIVSTGKITSDAGIDIDNFNIDGTTIALSSGDMTVDVAGDLILDAGGGDFKFGVGDTEILRITNSSSDVIIKPIVDAKDIIFQQRDGTAVMTVEDDISLTINNDVSVVGRATGTITTDNDGSLDLAVSNNFKVTTGGDLTLTLTNPAIGQSGNIFFINGSNHTISAHASLLINADVLSAISATGSYHLTYYSTATSGNNTILVSASAILT